MFGVLSGRKFFGTTDSSHLNTVCKSEQIRPQIKPVPVLGTSLCGAEEEVEVKTWIPLLDPLGGLLVVQKSWHQILPPSKSNELMRDNFYRHFHYDMLQKFSVCFFWCLGFGFFFVFFSAENEYYIFHRREINRQKT